MLSDKYTLDDVRQMLVPREDWHPYPTRDERDAWGKIPAATRNALLEKGDASLGFEWKVFRATQFMEMAKTGLRSLYGKHRQTHRNALMALVVAECIEAKGRYMDDIVDGVWAVCEESWWGKPWHLETQIGGADLANIEDGSVDLFVAETASLLSWTCYLLGPQLDNFSTMILPRIDYEIRQHILGPCLDGRDQHWMGFGRTSESRVNNWNPWITSNWITTILLMEKDPERRVAALHKSMHVLDQFIDPYPKDGGCDEGPGYWGRAGASMFECLESLHSATHGGINVYDDPLIQNIGQFITRVHIHDHYFVNFADAAALVKPSPFLVYRYGKRIGDADMMGMAAYFAKNQSKVGSDSIARLIPALLLGSELSAVKPYQPLPLETWLPDIQVMTARDRAGSKQGFYVAAKGGHNDESHNHNDVGHYIVFVDGEPVIIDAGVEAYTGKTFSAERYTIWTMQSAYHSLPTIDGIMQSPGFDFSAKDAAFESDKDKATFSIDIADAYPKKANLKTWRRTVTLERGREIRIEDHYALTQTPNKITMSLLTPCSVETSSGQIALKKRQLNDERSAGEATIHYDADQMTVHVEEIQLTDSKTKGYWGERISRIVFALTKPGNSGQLVLQLTR
jgi:hypothetical protein